MTRLAYVDSSALVKLVIEERESAAFLRWYVATDRIVTSRVGVIEIVRAAARQPHDPGRRHAILREVDVVELTVSTARRAEEIGPATLRTLDAIHLASAQRLAPELDAFVTYDDRLAAAARSLGLPVVRPS